MRGRYSVKLEGARIAGYQTTILSLLRNAHYVQHAGKWIERLAGSLICEIKDWMGLGSGEYGLEFRLIGANATLGSLENQIGDPVKLGVLGIVTAASQEVAAEIGKLINPFVLHCPLTENEELPTFAFPFSPATTDRRALYEFALNHIMYFYDPLDAFPLEVTQLGKEVAA